MALDPPETDTASGPRPGVIRLALTVAIVPVLLAALIGALDLAIRATTDRTRHGRYAMRQGLAFVKEPPERFELPRDWAAVARALPVTDAGIPPERRGTGPRVVAVGSSVGFFAGPRGEREPNLNAVCERALAGRAGSRARRS